MIYSLFFSPTGGTKKAADLILKEFKVDKYIDLTDQKADYSVYSFSEKDICFISVSSFGGRVPAIVNERLGKMKADGAYAVLVVSYGNREYEDTLIELKNTAEKAGFLAVAAVSAVTEHSIVRKFGEGRPDDSDVVQLSAFSVELKNMLEKGGLKSVSVPGNVPYKIFNGVPLRPETDDKCVKCGLCSRLCPVGAIDFENPSNIDNNKCIACMRCISICPKNSKKIDEKALSATEERLRKVCSERKANELFLCI